MDKKTYTPSSASAAAPFPASATAGAGETRCRSGPSTSTKFTPLRGRSVKTRARDVSPFNGSAAGAQGAQSAGAPQKASVRSSGTREAAVSTRQDISASSRNAMRAVVTFFRDRRFFFAGSPLFFVQHGAD